MKKFMDYLLYISLLSPLFFATAFKVIGWTVFDSIFYQFWSIGLFPLIIVGLMLVGLRWYGLGIAAGYLLLFFILFLSKGEFLHPLFYPYFIAVIVVVIEGHALFKK